MTLLSADQFADAIGISVRAAQQAYQRSASGKLWRGHVLPVVRFIGQQGGSGGETWALKVDDLPASTREMLGLDQETAPLEAPVERPVQSALDVSKGAPVWVHLLPAGHIVARDGRQFDLVDAAGLILDFQARGLDLPIDYEHQNDTPAAKLNGPVPAAGWIKELAHDTTGLWGRVEWTATAGGMIARKEYRYLSPSFHHNAAGQIMRLNGAGLVHKPALRLKALAQEDVPMAPDQQTPNTSPRLRLMARLLQALELQPDATEEEALEALEVFLSQKATAREQPDPARFVPIDAVRELMADRNTQLATMREQDAATKVDQALRAGHLTPAMRDWATALCITNPAAFNAFVTKSPAPYAHLHKPVAFGPIPTSGAAVNASPEALAICAQLGLTPERLAKG